MIIMWWHPLDGTSMSGLNRVFQSNPTLMREEALKKQEGWVGADSKPVTPAERLAPHTLLLREAPSETHSWLAPPRAFVGNLWLTQNSVFLWAAVCHWAWERLTWDLHCDGGFMRCLACRLRPSHLCEFFKTLVLTSDCLDFCVWGGVERQWKLSCLYLWCPCHCFSPHWKFLPCGSSIFPGIVSLSFP